MGKALATEASGPEFGSQGTVDTSHLCHLNTGQDRGGGEIGKFPWLMEPIIEPQVLKEDPFSKKTNNKKENYRRRHSVSTYNP